MSYIYVVQPNEKINMGKPMYYTGFKNHQRLGKYIANHLNNKNLRNISNNQKRKILSEFIQLNLSNEDVFEHLLNNTQRNKFNNDELLNMNRMITIFLNGNYNSQRNGWQSLIANIDTRQSVLNFATLQEALRTPLPDNF